MGIVTSWVGVLQVCGHTPKYSRRYGTLERDAMEFVMAIEEPFGISIQDGEAVQVSSVDDRVDSVANREFSNGVLPGVRSIF